MRYVTSFVTGAKFAMSAGVASRSATESAASHAALSGESLTED